MNCIVLKLPTESLQVTTTSRIIKANAVAEWQWAANLRECFEQETALAKQQHEDAIREARDAGYAEGVRLAHTDLSERLAEASQWLGRARTYFESAFAEGITCAVEQFIEQAASEPIVQAVIRHALASFEQNTLLRVVVHPEDRQLAAASIEALHLPHPPTVVEDATLSRHSCRLESALAVVEQDVSTLLEGVRRSVRMALDESREGTSDASVDAT